MAQSLAVVVRSGFEMASVGSEVNRGDRSQGLQAGKELQVEEHQACVGGTHRYFWLAVIAVRRLKRAIRNRAAEVEPLILSTPGERLSERASVQAGPELASVTTPATILNGATGSCRPPAWTMGRLVRVRRRTEAALLAAYSTLPRSSSCLDIKDGVHALGRDEHLACLLKEERAVVPVVDDQVDLVADLSL